MLLLKIRIISTNKGAPVPMHFNADTLSSVEVNELLYLDCFKHFSRTYISNEKLILFAVLKFLSSYV